MQMRAIVLAFSWAVSISTLAAPVPRPAPPQADEQHGGDTKAGIAGGEVKERSGKKKIADDPESETSAFAPRNFKALGREFLLDQEQIWTSPAKIRFSDTQWLVPASGITAGLFVTDNDFSKHLSQNPTTISHYKTLSNAGVAALVGGAGGMWVMGQG